MHTYEPKKFTVPTLDGISEESIKQHIGLYEGYVKNMNAMSMLINDLSKDVERNSLAVAELLRRRSFEFDGMRLHEYYFSQFEGGPKTLAAGDLSSALDERFGAGKFETVMRTTANVRGPGWAILYYDPTAQGFLVGFVGEQHQGHLATLPILLALDVWEHCYILDYGASGRGKYVDAFFKNLNWDVVISRFEQMRG